MRIVTLLALIAFPLALASCQTAADRRAADEAACAGYGFKPGTQAFSNCLMNQDLARRADNRAFLYGSQDDFFWGPGVVVGGGYYRRGHW